MDYTTVASVKTYLALDRPGADALIAQLIPRECRFIDRYCGRKFGALTTRLSLPLNGTGTDRQPLPDRPIVSVSGVTVCQQALKYDPTGLNVGFTFDDTLLYLNLGQRFPRGRQNVFVSYVAGYQGVETGMIPVTAPLELTPDDVGRAVRAVSVVVGATPLTQVSANPSAGQFALDPDLGKFTFAATEAGKDVVMTYVAVPAPVEQAANEMVGLDLKQRDNLGISSKSLAGESITYSDSAMTKSTKTMLDVFSVKWLG